MKRSTAFTAMTVISAVVGIVAAAPYFTLDPAQSRVAINPELPAFYALLVAHIFTAFVALVIGPVQFIERIRIDKPKLHLRLGQGYMVCILASGICGLAITFFVESYGKALAFLVLNVLWLFTCWRGYVTARRKQFRQHRVWMIRNYAMTLVAVAARVLVPVCILLYLAFNGFRLPEGREQMIADILEVNIWLGLAVNLILIEWVIKKPETGA